MKKVLYMVNSLREGGAEKGLEFLIESNFFNDVDLHVVVLTRTNSALEKRLTEKLAGAITICNAQSFSIANIFRILLFVHSAIQKKSPDIVIASLTQAVLVSRLISLFYKCKHVTFEHSTKYASQLAYILLKMTDFTSGQFLVDSEITRAALFDRAKRGALYVPLYSSKDTPCDDIKKIYAVGDQLKVFSVGRLVATKNYEKSLFALSLLQQRGFKFTYSIYGEGPEYEELNALVNKLSLDGITFHGYCDDWQSRAKDYDCYLLNSNYEGLSIATLEAMNAALPAVVTPVGEIAHYGKNGDNCIYVASVESIADALMKVAKSEQANKRLGVHARHTVMSKFNSDTVSNQLSIAAKELYGA